MFEKFGEFDSSEELNKAAEGLLKEGDIESLKILAAENGIDKDDVEDYEIGLIDSLTTPLTAAYGKLDIETAQLNITEIMEDWMQYIRLQCLNDSKMASEVRKKGKTLKGCIAALIKWSFSEGSTGIPPVCRQICGKHRCGGTQNQPFPSPGRWRGSAPRGSR